MYLDTIVIIVLFCFNILLSGYSLYADEMPFSLNKIYWIFNLVFLSAVPALQYFLGIFSWQQQFESTTIVIANALILLCNMVYSIVRGQLMKRNKQKTFDDLRIIESAKKNVNINLFLGVYVVAAFGLIVLQGKALFLRSETTLLSTIANSFMQLLIDKSLKGITLFGVLFIIYLRRSKQLSFRVALLLVLLGFLANFSLAVPRYWAATFHIAFLLTFFASYWQKRKYFFANMMLAICVFVFPIFTVFRYSFKQIGSSFASLKEVFVFSFTKGDFDAYTSFCNTLIYVQNQGITWGKQLASVLLFFIPRSLWKSKSVGSGALVNHLPHSDFHNFCSPFIAEGYINFGIVGALVFVGLLAVLVVRYDYFFWHKAKFNFNYTFYPIAIGMLFFVLRGDLLSSFAYTVGFYISGACFFYFLKKSE